MQSFNKERILRYDLWLHTGVYRIQVTSHSLQINSSAVFYSLINLLAQKTAIIFFQFLVIDIGLGATHKKFYSNRKTGLYRTYTGLPVVEPHCFVIGLNCKLCWIQFAKLQQRTYFEIRSLASHWCLPHSGNIPQPTNKLISCLLFTN